MAVTIKSEREIELMRQAGKYIAMAHAELEKEVKPGMSTYQIDKIGEEIIRSYGCIPTCLGYEGYPASLCISVNDEVVHGIPRKDRFVENGDIVSLDFCLSYKGYQSDCARTLAIGEISDDAKQLIEVTKQCFFEGIKYAKEGCHLYQISAAINDYADKFGAWSGCAFNFSYWQRFLRRDITGRNAPRGRERFKLHSSAWTQHSNLSRYR